MYTHTTLYNNTCDEHTCCGSPSVYFPGWLSSPISVTHVCTPLCSGDRMTHTCFHTHVTQMRAYYIPAFCLCHSKTPLYFPLDWSCCLSLERGCELQPCPPGAPGDLVVGLSRDASSSWCMTWCPVRHLDQLCLSQEACLDWQVPLGLVWPGPGYSYRVSCSLGEKLGLVCHPGGHSPTHTK